MTFAQFLEVLQADPAILIPGAAQASQRTQFVSHGHAQAMHRRSIPDLGAKRPFGALVRRVVALRKAGKKK